MGQKLTGRILLLVLLLCAFVPAVRAQTVWAVNDGEKVERDDLNNPNKRGNSAWDGRKIKIFGARNEVIAFQVIVEAEQAGVKQLSVRLPELRRRGGRGVIRYGAPAPD